jgi:Chlorophyllase enzyme
MFANFLNEIASHGFFIVANGPATGNQLGGMTTYRELIKSIDWLEKSPQAKKWKLDTTKLAVAGQSCGGLEAVSRHSCGGLGQWAHGPSPPQFRPTENR